MPQTTLPDGADAIMPNGLLIIAAIGSMTGPGITCSPISDEVGYALGQNAAWVRRHGIKVNLLGNPDTTRREGFLSLSTNGHCSLTRQGRVVERLLRTAVPAVAAPVRCGHCGAARVGETHAGRQLYACGRVMQWCPDHIPGHPRAEVPKRSEKAQHTGVWFRAFRCGAGRRYRWSGDIAVGCTTDGAEIIPGMLVSANRSSCCFGLYGTVMGTVTAAANGTVLVDWPAVGNPDPWFDRPEVYADIMVAHELLTPGAPDASALSDYQSELLAAIRDNRVLLEVNGDGTYGGRFKGRKITPRSLEVLIECRLLEPPPVPARIGLTDYHRELRYAIYLGEVTVERTEDGAFTAVHNGRRVKAEVLEVLVNNGLLPETRVPAGRPREAALADAA